jgi:hypothetical protein
VQGAGGCGAPWSPSYGIDGGGNLDANPLFISSSDLHLGPGCPAINVGNSSFLPAGYPRIVGGSVDMGHYEVQDTTPPDSTIDNMPADPIVSSDASFSFSPRLYYGQVVWKDQIRTNNGYTEYR